MISSMSKMSSKPYTVSISCSVAYRADITVAKIGAILVYSISLAFPGPPPIPKSISRRALKNPYTV